MPPNLHKRRPNNNHEPPEESAPEANLIKKTISELKGNEISIENVIYE